MQIMDLNSRARRHAPHDDGQGTRRGMVPRSRRVILTRKPYRAYYLQAIVGADRGSVDASDMRTMKRRPFIGIAVAGPHCWGFWDRQAFGPAPCPSLGIGGGITGEGLWKTRLMRELAPVGKSR